MMHIADHRAHAIPYPKLLDWLRYICAFNLYMYGASKLVHLQLHLPAEFAQRPIGSLNGYLLTWYYYGYSPTYTSILGLVQFTGATLLLFRRSSLLGAAIMAPVMANILLINIFYLVGDYGANFMAAFIFASMVMILWRQRTVLVCMLWGTQSAEPESSRTMHRLIRGFILLAFISIMIVGLLMQPHK